MPISQCRHATAMLSPVEIKSKMSRVTLTRLHALHYPLAMRKLGVMGVVALPPVALRLWYHVVTNTLIFW